MYIKIEWIVNEFLLIDFGVIVVIYNYYLSIFFIVWRYKIFENVFEMNFKNVNFEIFIIKIDFMICSYKKNNEKVLRNFKVFVDYKLVL